MLKRIIGFTLIELLIVVAIIIILALVALGAWRDAGAHEIVQDHPALKSYLDEAGAQYQWGNNTHTLVIINRGTAKWASVGDACNVMTSLDNTLAGMQLILQDGTSGTAELRWDNSGEGKVLTNLPSTDFATC